LNEERRVKQILAEDTTTGKSKIFKGREIVGGKGQAKTGGHHYRCIYQVSDSEIIEQTNTI